MLATLALGWAVGDGTTSVDSWFHRITREALGGQPRWLLIFTSSQLALAVLVSCQLVALRRRQWKLSTAVLVCPFLATAIGEALKRLFDRRNGPYLEYPSGHTTLLVTALGMMVVIAAARVWAVTVAVAVSLLGMLGLIACGYHYLTDTIGAALLATTLVCGAARLTSPL
ncbi:MAG: phosphatase PAP2 family protein [Mycobacterium sp.]